jgi:transcriptional regulator with XRE-family HTH domain
MLDSAMLVPPSTPEHARRMFESVSHDRQITDFVYHERQMSSSGTNDSAQATLISLGARLRAQRKALDLNSAATAEAAGISRMTLHRIERGEGTVTVAAYVQVAAALGLDLDVTQRQFGDFGPPSTQGWIPARVSLSDYPQLRYLAWSAPGLNELAPSQALAIYQRNWQHVDEENMPAHERDLVAALRLAFDAPKPERNARHGKKR